MLTRTCISQVRYSVNDAQTPRVIKLYPFTVSPS